MDMDGDNLTFRYFRAILLTMAGLAAIVMIGVAVARFITGE